MKTLFNDTISFNGKPNKTINIVTEALEQTNKKIGSYEEAARFSIVKDITESFEQSHKDLKKKIRMVHINME